MHAASGEFSRLCRGSKGNPAGTGIQKQRVQPRAADVAGTYALPLPTSSHGPGKHRTRIREHIMALHNITTTPCVDRQSPWTGLHEPLWSETSPKHTMVAAKKQSRQRHLESPDQMARQYLLPGVITCCSTPTRRSQNRYNWFSGSVQKHSIEA